MVAVSLVTSLVHGDAILYVTGFLFIIGGTAGLLGFLAIVGVAWQER